MVKADKVELISWLRTTESVSWEVDSRLADKNFPSFMCVCVCVCVFVRIEASFSRSLQTAFKPLLGLFNSDNILIANLMILKILFNTT